ncbi:MAG: NAD(P)-dependent dehydrogenase (short-subunit alcohol dehydrogenase family) [Flavobacteriaceae bacterium]|jgi:NAD(P)-dependent dehydrogenase (short-subunit alcohol dehydrogenase family)|tara:strand:- start:299 stop:1093 length:795 start_codon:yes stop_codon:yes gene_type:complete
MDLNLKGKIAFISGSTSGIGFTTARILLAEGMKVYINGRKKETVNNAVTNLQTITESTEVFGIVADFRNPKEVMRLLQELSEIDVLVNNVGIYNSQSFFETTSKQWEEQFQVNFMSGVRLSNHYLQKMLHKKWGRIIFISSECAYLVPNDMISYSTTKAAMHALSRGLSQLTGGTGVTVNTVVPGSTLSEGAKHFIADKAAKEGRDANAIESTFFKTERTQSLLERFASTDEVATMIAYLCSPLSSATNGAVIKVDGGSTGGVF